MNDNDTQNRYAVERLGFETSPSHNETHEISDSQFQSINNLSNESGLGQAEVLLTNPELTRNPSQSNSTQQISVTPQDIPDSSQSSMAVVQQNSSNGGSGSVADDVDLIEKEWVEKAKSIVTKTFNDPYLQNKAFGNLRSEYMKKRFGKTIKTED